MCIASHNQTARPTARQRLLAALRSRPSYTGKAIAEHVGEEMTLGQLRDLRRLTTDDDELWAITVATFNAAPEELTVGASAWLLDALGSEATHA